MARTSRAAETTATIVTPEAAKNLVTATARMQTMLLFPTGKKFAQTSRNHIKLYVSIATVLEFGISEMVV